LTGKGGYEISKEEAEYLLIADNEERRQGDDDPIKKAKRAKFLREYWEVKWGGSRGNQYTGKNSEMKMVNNSPFKTFDNITKAIGESRDNGYHSSRTACVP